jgi:hypothetical protein
MCKRSCAPHGEVYSCFLADQGTCALQMEPLARRAIFMNTRTGTVQNLHPNVAQLEPLILQQRQLAEEKLEHHLELLSMHQQCTASAARHRQSVLLQNMQGCAGSSGL